MNGTLLTAMVANLYRPSSWFIRYGLAFVSFICVLGLASIWPSLRAFFIIPVLISGWVGGLVPSILVAVFTVVGYSAIVYGGVPLTVDVALQVISLMIVGALSDLLYTSVSSASTQSQRLSTLLASISDGVLIGDKAGRVTYLNTAAEALTGRTLAGCRNQPVGQAFPPVSEPYAQVLRTGQPTTLSDTRFTDGQGRERYVEGDLTPYHHPADGSSGVVIALRDVTARRQAERRLKESEKNFRRSLEGTPVTVFHQDKDLRYTWVHNATLHDDESLIGRHDADLIDDPESLRRVLDLKQRVLESGAPTYDELAVKLPDGGVSHHLLYAHPAEGGIMATSVTITARKEAEEALRRNEARLKAAVENSPLTVVELDRDLRYVWVAGLPDSMRDLDMIGQPQADFLPAEHLEPIQRAERQVIETGETVRRTDLVRLPDGSVSYWDRTFLPRYDANGEIVGVTVAAVNITDLKETEARLRESEERLNTAIRNSPLTMLSFDTGLRYQWVANPHPTFDPEAAIGRHVTDVLPGEEGQELALLMKHVLQSGEGLRMHLTFALPNTSALTWDTTIEPVYDTQGTIKGLTVAAMDVSDRIRLMREVATERDKLRAVIDSVSDEIWFFDAAGELQLVNQAVRDTFGIEDDELPHLDDLIHELQILRVDGTLRPPEEAPMLRVLAGEPVAQVEEILIHPVTRQHRHREGAIIPLIDMDGTLYGAVASVRDITHQKQMEAVQGALLESERQARAKAERADAIKTKFFGVISHEMRTPLTSILGFADTLLADDVAWNEAEQRDFIGIILQEAVKLETLIGDLLDVSHIESGSFKVKAEVHTVSELMAIARTNLEQLARHHRLTVNVQRDLPIVEADPFRVSQVMSNLVGNAAKFSPEGTAIVVCVEQTSDVMVCITVTDEGPGIPPEEHELIFDAFQRSSVTENEPGAGLGLAICKGIVEAHGGRIWIEDTPSGTAIAFTLPLSSGG